MAQPTCQGGFLGSRGCVRHLGSRGEATLHRSLLLPPQHCTSTQKVAKSSWKALEQGEIVLNFPN